MRTETIEARFEPEEKALIQEAATLAGLSVAAFMRAAVLRAAREATENAR